MVVELLSAILKFSHNTPRTQLSRKSGQVIHGSLHIDSLICSFLYRKMNFLFALPWSAYIVVRERKMVEFLPEGYYRIERNRTIWEVPEKYNRLSSLSSKRSNGTEGYRQVW